MIPARTTFYNGVMMRSRLEASFAAMLDRRGIEWRYEPFVVASSLGQWLPDFELATPLEELTLLVEVKPSFDAAVHAVQRVGAAVYGSEEDFQAQRKNPGPLWHLEKIVWPDAFPAGDVWWVMDPSEDTGYGPHFLKRHPPCSFGQHSRTGGTGG